MKVIKIYIKSCEECSYCVWDNAGLYPKFCEEAPNLINKMGKLINGIPEQCPLEEVKNDNN